MGPFQHEASYFAHVNFGGFNSGDLLRWRRRFRSSHRCRSLSGGWRWRRHGGGVPWRMVVEPALMAIVMTTTAPEELSYVRFLCRASGIASTEAFVKFKSAVPGNREIYDAF